MSKGVAKTSHLDGTGVITHNNAPNWDFLYETSTIKNPNYNIGDRVVLPDGRVFRYAYADTARTSGYAMQFNASVAQGYTNLAANQAIGDKSVQVVSAVALTKDELRGGYITLYTGDPNNTFRGIIGNTACSAAGTTTIYLDATLHKAVTTSTGSEFFYNPYAHVCEVPLSYGSVAGIAIADMSTVGYCWIQTWGMIRLTFKPGANPGTTIEARQLVFGPDGPTWAHGSDAVGPSGDKGYCQHAGFVVDKTSAGTGSYALIMLQISP